MSDEEDYNSEEDADYVPSDGELGSEEENSGDEEDLSVLADDATAEGDTGSKKTRQKKQKKNSKELAPRVRKGGIKLADGNPSEERNGGGGNTELAQAIKEEETQKKQEKEKKRTDDLWASFLSDVKVPPKPSPNTAKASIVTKQPASSAGSSATTPTTAASSTVRPTAKPTSGKVTITKIFDFAGEEVKVTKEVDASSKEAQAELKKQEEKEEEVSTTTASTSSLSASSSALTPKPTSHSILSPGSSILGGKRPAETGLGGLLSKIGKKQKMGTLEKSKMDWENFKQKEGIQEDLKIHNKGKDGYIERMAFLNRTDVRQFEIERDLRLSKSGKR